MPTARWHRGPGARPTRGPQGGVGRALATIIGKGAEAGPAVRARACMLTRGAGGRGREGRRRRREGDGGGGGGVIGPWVVEPQMIQPPLFTEASEYQVIDCPAVIAALTGPDVAQ